MSIYALIDASGKICQIEAAVFPVAPPMVWTADISTDTPDPQVGWSAQQNSGAWTFSAPPAPPAPTLAQQAAELIADGIAITSTGTTALNGTYTVQSGVPFGQEDIATEAQFISTFSEFTNGETTNLSWPLINGTFVEFPTTAEFLAFSKAAAQFVAAVKLALGKSTSLPPATAEIP